MNAIKQYQERAEPSPTPLNMMLETSAVCNLTCPMCPRQHGARSNRIDGIMAWSTFLKIQPQLNPLRLAMFFSGEPLLNPRLAQMCSEARRVAEIPSIRLYTNGTLLDNDDTIRSLLTCGLDKLIFSFECNAKAQRRLRAGSDYKAVRFNILRTMELKWRMRDSQPGIRTPDLMIQHIVGKGVRASEIERSRAWWKRMGMRTRVQSINWFAGEVEDFTDERRHLARCREIWTNAIVSWQGDVTPCCIDHGFQLAIGNMLRTPLAELWHGPKLTDLRNAHIHYNATGDASRLPKLCQRCLRVGKEQTP